MFTCNGVSEANHSLQKEDMPFISISRNTACTVWIQHSHCNPDEFEITEAHRFEGSTDAAIEAIVYDVESKDGQKGIMVHGYGPEADTVTNGMAMKLQILHQP